MLNRVKRHLGILSVFVLAGSCFFFLLRNQEYSLALVVPSSNDVNVTERLQDGACRCSPCEFQQLEREVMDWDSSKVLRGSPTKRFRGMISRQHLMIQRV